VKSIIHLSSGDEFDRRVACERTKGLMLSSLETEIILYADIDGVRMLVTEAPEEADIRSFLDDGVRVLGNRECFELRDISLDSVIEGVELTGDSTEGLTRLQMEGATYIKAP
jgi:intracellular sulfur oxidation DsrE/DsrF family protein